MPPLECEFASVLQRQSTLALHSITPELWRDISEVSSSPEVYPRPDGTVYMCGGGSSDHLPKDPATILPQQSYVEEIMVRLQRLRVCSPQ